MVKVSDWRALLILGIVFTFSACSTSKIDSNTAAEQTPKEVSEPLQPNPVISSAGLEWPELVFPETCAGQPSPPTIHLCVHNQGTGPAALQYANVALPAGLAPAVQADILNTLPGGTWKPAEFIPIDGLPGADGSAEGIIIVDSMPAADMGAEGIGWGGMPFGFEMEGMMAMMGGGGFGPGPYLYGRLELAAFGFPAELKAGEESCIQVALSPLQGDGPGGPDSSFPADSFFDVFFEIDPQKPQSADSSSTAMKVVQIPIPSLPLCTPTPFDILPTSTPTRPPTGPVNTPTYTRPTSTPPSRFVPTPTPGGRS